ncbi:hypothetical protein SSEA_SKINNY_37 [Mycobacterium phage Skinny]|uniref:Uncharacterized protein n=6 Tax=Bongovirus bongo TaxID=1983750 RepID=A0A0M4S3Z9_9CAUD|nr:hypothetical protein PEGLEG_36 [Mycobacterium phage PegLeg]YP_009604894.1 hypothetical protein FDH95_gp036 [Mycobacterium phage Bongo]ALF00564.1 hypothetical protein SEA_BRICOLE_36 [Mycobacterium phage Bricole]AXQ52677.1 hypothetical protein SEA_IPHANE7_36 [Mycobacterium phage IPhane7]QDH93609.1 hypothetical protein SEA_LILHOMIEP_35 [Mycobacterium phage LilhomieP]QGJ93183.1 hypothetical protein SEA_TYDAWG_36 [Mycobacterium phage TyDawg]QUU29236.1 hypothetical protein [Mycobacterium phage S
MNKLVNMIVAALFPLLWAKLEPLVREVLAEKLDDLVPDEIEKFFSALIPDGVAEQLPGALNDVVNGVGAVLGGIFKPR